MNELSVFVALLVVILSFIYVFFKRRFTYWTRRGVTQLEPCIPLGNVPLEEAVQKDIFHQFYEIKDGSPLIGGYFLAMPIAIPTDLDFVQAILVKDFNSFNERGIYYNEVDDPVSAHLFAINGEKWRPLRTKLTPSFTSSKMKFMFQTVVEVADRFKRVLDDHLENDRILDMRELIARFATDVIGTCAFGIECDSMRNPNSEFRYYGRKAVEDPAVPLIFSPLVLQFPNLARRLHIRFAKKDVGDFFMQTVRETIDFREANDIRRNDFMDLLIRLKHGESLEEDGSKGMGKLSFEEVVAQVFVFFLAGFETSSTTMTFALYELALNPEIQAKARREIETILKNHDGQLTYEAVNEMTYIDRIINETLRKYPPISSLFRSCVRDYHVANTEIVIEKGTMLFIPSWSFHHDPDIFPDPEVFDPERFLPEEIRKRHPMAFLGFGDGPRNCIGLRFGRMQTRLGLITLLQNYRFRPCTRTPIPMVYAKTSPILAPEGEVYFEVEKVE